MVRFVAFPVTPNPVNGDLVYRPDCFASKTLDTMPKVTEGFTVIGARATRNGPAYACYAPLERLVDCDLHDRYGAALHARNGAFCANVSFYKKILKGDSGKKHGFGIDVEVNSLSIMHRSCNAGSHIVVPCAPVLTALCHYSQGMDITMGLTYYTSDECELMFPGIPFAGNSDVEEFASSAKLDLKVAEKLKHLDIYDQQCLWSGMHLSASDEDLF